MKINHVLKIVIGLLLLFTLVSFAITPVVATGTVYYDKTRNYDPSQFFVKYDVNSSFTLPTGWVKVQDFKSLPGLIVVETPANTTVKDAMDYICSLDGVIYTEPNYISSTIPKETDSKAIYSGYRTDRIKVVYNTSEPERLPWNVIYVFDESPRETNMLLEIPEGMTLEEAIEYCKNISSIVRTVPGDGYIQSVILGQGMDLSIQTDVISIIYDRNSSYRLPWILNSQNGDIYTYIVPNNMTFPEAFAYCNRINEIMYVGTRTVNYISTDSSEYSGRTPMPLVGILLGLLCAGLFSLRYRVR